MNNNKARDWGALLCVLLLFAHVHAHTANLEAISILKTTLERIQSIAELTESPFAPFLSLLEIQDNDTSHKLADIAVGEKGVPSDEEWFGKGVTTFNTSNLWTVVPMFMAIVVCLTVAWAGTSVGRGREVMWEGEKMFLKFEGNFDRFIQAASKHPGTVRDRWISQVCLLAGDISPKPLVRHADTPAVSLPETATPTINGNSDTTTPAPIQAAQVGVVNAVPPAVPVSLNGVIADVLRPRTQNDLFQRQLDELFRLHSQTSLLEISESSNVPDAPPLLQFTIEKMSDVEIQNAKDCWDQLKEDVLQQRDFRSWRVAVRTSMFVLSAIAFFLGLLLLVAGVSGLMKLRVTRCRTDLLVKEYKDVDCTGGNTMTCRASCEKPNTFRYFICSVMNGQSQWVPMLMCPEDHLSA